MLDAARGRAGREHRRTRSQAQEAERHRIAQELHDEVGQSLTAVLLGLKRAADRAPADLADELRAVQETARSSLDEVRRVARRLRPGVLEDLGLLSALAALATDFSAAQRRAGPPRVSSRTCRRSAGRPSWSSTGSLRRRLTNAARHADADLVELSLTRQGDGVALRIADDGRGLQGAAEGAGIRGMRERAMLVGAQLDDRAARRAAGPRCAWSSR